MTKPGPESVRSMQAGLLWRLLDPASRTRIASFLPSDSLVALRRNFDAYQAGSQRDRARVENGLRREGQTQWGPRPILGFVVGMILTGAGIVILKQTEPRIGWMGLAVVLTPLVLAACGPLSLLLVRPYQARSLFHLRFRALPWVLTVLCSLGLIWVLSFIGFEDKLRPHLHGALLVFVVIGVAGAPLLEEVFFREVLPSIFGRSPHYLGHMLSALLFAAAHLPDSFNMGFLYFAAAAALSALRVETDSLFYPVLAHSAANAAMLFL